MVYDGVRRIIAQKETVTRSNDGQTISVDVLMDYDGVSHRKSSRWNQQNCTIPSIPYILQSVLVWGKTRSISDVEKTKLVYKLPFLS